jgi:hypothetical protein
MTVRACSTALASRGKTGDDLADPSGGGEIRDESMLISTTRLTIRSLQKTRNGRERRGYNRDSWFPPQANP